MRNFQDTLYICKRGSTRFKKQRSPIFHDNYEQNKKSSAHLVDIVKGTACKKVQKKEILLGLELLEVFVNLNKRPDFGKSLS